MGTNWANKESTKNQVFLNRFHATGLFLYPVKTENQRFLGGIERDQWHEMG